MQTLIMSTLLLPTEIAKEPNLLIFGPLAVPGSILSMQVHDQLGSPLTAKVVFAPANENALEAAARTFVGRSVKFGLRYNPKAQYSGIVQSNPVCFFERGVVEFEIRGRIGRLEDRHHWRTFSEQTTQDIVRSVLTDAGFNAQFKTPPGRSHPCCIQAGKSDLDFVSGLVQAEGWEFDDECRFQAIPRPHSIERIPVRSPMAAQAESGLESLRMVFGKKTSVSGSGDIVIRAGEFLTVGQEGRIFRAQEVVLTAIEGGSGRQESWACAFEGIESSIPQQSFGSAKSKPRLISRPAIQSCLCATVVGPDGKQQDKGAPAVHPETQRVRIRFDWDPIDDLTRSPLVPVATSCHGMHGWPRCGDRVLVEFENGDSRQPRITGIQLPEPGESSVDGSDAYTLCIGHSRGSGKQKSSPTIIRITPTGTDAGLSIQSAGRMTRKIARSCRTSVGKSQSITIRGSRYEKIGANSFTHAEKEITLEAGTKITLKVGESVIVISAEGITINGRKLYLNSPGGPQPGECAAPEDVPDLKLRKSNGEST